MLGKLLGSNRKEKINNVKPPPQKFDAFNKKQ